MTSDAFLVLGRERSALAFCDVGCFNVYSVYQDCSNMMEAKALKNNKKACFYCASCGRAVNIPKTCMIHDDGCPEYLWYAAYPTVSDFIDEWISIFGNDEITEHVWDTADIVARANPLLPGADLAELVIKRLGY